MDVPVFSMAERDRRWALARKLMAAEDVDALVVWGGPDCGGAAEFAPDTFFSNDRRRSVIIFCRDSAPVQLIGPEQQVRAHQDAGRSGQVWIEAASIEVGADAPGIAAVLRRSGLEQAPVGVLGPGLAAAGRPGEVAGCAWCRQVRTRLPQVKFKEVGRGFLVATVCLSQEELAVVRYCAAAGQAAVRAMAATVVPGVTDAAVCAAGTAAATGFGCAASTLMWSGQRFAVGAPPSWPGGPEPPRVLADGDVLLAEISPRLFMRETRHQVAIAIGDPHPDTETAAVIASASYQAGVRASQAGNTFGDLAEAMLMPLKQAGLPVPRPLVRLLGAPGQVGRQLPLAPGMSCALGPAVVVAGHPVSLGGTVVVGENGPIELSPFTTQLLRVRPTGPRISPNGSTQRGN